MKLYSRDGRVPDVQSTSISRPCRDVQNIGSESAQKAFYEDYYETVGKSRNDLRTNRGVLYQILASEAAFVKAFYEIDMAPGTSSVLDVGCGSGASLYQLLRLGYQPRNLTGIDIQMDRLLEARKTYPHSSFIHADASGMVFSDSSFDVVLQSTMLATLADTAVRFQIASEMIRVCKFGGYLIVIDWRVAKIWDRRYKAITMNEVKSLFGLGKTTTLVGTYHGALVPPLGRFLSRRIPSLYFLIAALCPFLVGQVVYLLQKLPATES